MASETDLKCWEIMKCDNTDCPARSEPETPCWEIAKRLGDFRDTSNICRDCIVFMLKGSTSGLNSNKLQKIMEQRESFEETEKNYNECILKALTNG